MLRTAMWNQWTETGIQIYSRADRLETWNRNALLHPTIAPTSFRTNTSESKVWPRWSSSSARLTTLSWVTDWLPWSARSILMRSTAKGPMCTWRRWSSGMRASWIIGRCRVTIARRREISPLMWNCRLEDMRNCWARQTVKESPFSTKLPYFLRKIINWELSFLTGKPRTSLSWCVSWVRSCSSSVFLWGNCRSRVRSCEGRWLRWRVSWTKRIKRYGCLLWTLIGRR